MFKLFKRSLPQPELKSTTYFMGMNIASGIGDSYTKLAKEGYSENAIVYACINKIADALASVDLQAYTQNAEGKLERKPNSDLEKLLNAPNAYQSSRMFRKELITQYLIGGNGFIAGTKTSKNGNAKFSELIILPPDKMKVEAGDMLPSAYVYEPRQGTKYTYPVDIKGRSDVLHIKTPNPLNRWTGLAPMLAAAYGVDIFNSGMRWNKKLLDNDCRPAGALSVEDANGLPRALTEEQRKELSEAITNSFSGANNAGRPLLLNGGMKWQQLSVAPKDMDFRENMLMAARFIASVFQIPPQLINIPGESTYSNYEQAEMSFWANTALPLLGSVLEDFNRWLSPLYGDEFIWYDEEAIPALEPMRKLKGDRVNVAAYLTTNEKRHIMGNEETSGGDEILIDSGKIPLSLLDASMTEPAPVEPVPAPPEE